MKCINCNSETKNPKFCCHSCSASFNNNKREKRTAESRQRTRESILKYLHSCNPDDIIRRQQSKLKAVETRRRNHPPKTEKEVICSFCKQSFIIKFDGTTRNSTLCSDECYRKMKSYNAKGIKRQEYNGNIFDSGYEVLIAKYLDEKNIEWVIPKNAIYWFDSTGKQRRYFPDFYLPLYDIYLDPKNPYCISQQLEKLNAVLLLIKLLYGEPKAIIHELETNYFGHMG